MAKWSGLSERFLMWVWPGCRPGGQTWKPGVKNNQGRNFTPNSQKPKESENEYKLNATGTQGSNRRSIIQSPRLRDIPVMDLRGDGAGSESEGRTQSKRGWVCVIPFRWLLAAGCDGWIALIFRDSGRTGTPNPGQPRTACLPDSLQTISDSCSELMKTDSNGVRTASSPPASILLSRRSSQHLSVGPYNCRYYPGYLASLYHQTWFIIYNIVLS